jgi:hypothetical protein
MSGMPDQMVSACFMLAWEEFGDDKSTEFLVQITADRLGIEPEEVYDALASVHGDQQSPQETAK